jgi:hypothetical protein
MTKETVDDPRQAPPRAYPPLDPAQIAAINAKLVAIAALRHPGDLTADQLADLTAAVEQQTRHLETLHRFPLNNADEPAFVRSPLGASR